MTDPYRGSCLCGVVRFEFDSNAREIAVFAVEARFDQKLRALEASFLYLPFEHAEDLALQDRSVALFEKLVSRAPVDLRPMFDQFLAYAIRHREVIRQFGRFPHRNAVLGRASTAAEIEYLSSKEAFTG